MQLFKLFVALLLLTGCATGPKFDTINVNPSLTPAQAVTKFNSARNSRVIWGGIIISATNLEGKTRFEVLSYPLSRSQRPNTDAAPQGRFLATKDGYVETLDYSPGKRITVTGTLTETREGRIGESLYIYPVVQTESLYLWTTTHAATEPRINFGIGVILHN